MYDQSVYDIDHVLERGVSLFSKKQGQLMYIKGDIAALLQIDRDWVKPVTSRSYIVSVVTQMIERVVSHEFILAELLTITFLFLAQIRYKSLEKYYI